MRNYSASSKLPMLIIIPNTVPIIVGQDVPASGRDGAGESVGPWAISVEVAVGAVVGVDVTVAVDVAVAVGVGDGDAVGQRQFVLVRHCAFLQFPLVDPVGI